MRRLLLPFFGALGAIFIAGACDDGTTDGGSGEGGKKPPGPTCTDCTPAGPGTYALPSPSGATLWTTTTMDKVLREAAPPTGAFDIRLADHTRLSSAALTLDHAGVAVRDTLLGPLRLAGADLAHIERRR